MLELFTFYFRLPFLFYISAVLLYVGALFSFVRHMNRLESDLKAVPSLRHTDVKSILHFNLTYITLYPYQQIFNLLCYDVVMVCSHVILDMIDCVICCDLHIHPCRVPLELNQCYSLNVRLNY
jgi:hypothetical protein